MASARAAATGAIAAERCSWRCRATGSRHPRQRRRRISAGGGGGGAAAAVVTSFAIGPAGASRHLYEASWD